MEKTRHIYISMCLRFNYINTENLLYFNFDNYMVITAEGITKILIIILFKLRH